MRVLSVLFLFALVLLVCGCGSDEPSSPSQDEISSIMEAAGKVVPPTEKDEITDTRSEDVGDYRYTYETHDVVDNIDNIVYLGLNDDVIWPGNIVRGDRASSYVYEPISVDRGPLTLSLSLETSTTGQSIKRAVPEPTLSNVRQGISDLLRDAIVEGTYVPAKVEFSKQEVYSASQMSLFVGADVSYGVGDLSTAFDWQSTEQKTKIVAKYKQIYYSVDMDTPRKPSALLSSGITLDQVRDAFPAGCLPIYVAGVSYGVMAIFTIETSFSYEEMNLAMDGAYHGTVDVKLSSGFTAREMLQQSNVRIVVYGGSTLGLNAIEQGFDGFMKVVHASTQFNSTSPGVPLVYKFRHCTDNTLALVTLTSQYTLVRPLKLRERVRLTVNSFYCEMADDEALPNTVDMDRFQVKAWAYERPNESASETSCLNETSVYYWSTPGEHNMDAGDTWNTTEPNSVDIVFDTEHNNFNLCRLHLWGWARDYDLIGANEDGYGEVNIYGARFFEGAGEHTFLLNSADFRFRVKVTLEALN